MEKNFETAIREKKVKKNKMSFFSHIDKTLLLCFAVPFFSMILIYCCMTVWPVGKNSVLVLDLNAQYVYYFEELRRIITEGGSLLYSFSRALGGEFMGIFAYYLSSPFSLLVALFPKEAITEALYLILVLKTAFCGLTFGFYLKKKISLRPLYIIMLSAMYALSSFAVVMQHNLMWMDNVLIFPLLLYAIDELICSKKYKMYVICLVYSIMSNFYIGYMTCLFVFVWFFIRYFMLSKDERTSFPTVLVRIGLSSIVSILISAVIILPVYYSLSFGKLEFSTPDFTPKQMFEFLDILTKAFFGSYDSVRPSGMPFIYCGTPALILAPLYFFSPKIERRNKIGYAVTLLFFIFSFNFSIADIIWHGMQRPNWLNARFSYMFVFIVLVMTAEVLSDLKKIGRRSLMLSSVLWCAMLLILSKIGYEHLIPFITVWPAIIFFTAYAGIFSSCAKTDNKTGLCRQAAAFALFSVTLFELIANGVIMLYRLDEDVSFSTRSSYRTMVDNYSKAVALINDNSFYRAEKLYHRKKNDNFALGINGLSNSTSTLNANAIELLCQFGYSSMSHWSLYSGATPVSDAIFGIKYIMADESDDKPVMEYIHDMYTLYASTDDGIDVYENPYSLSVMYSVNKDVEEYNVRSENETDYKDPFTYMNELLSAMCGHKVTVWNKCSVKDFDYPGCRQFFTFGHKGYEAESDEAKVRFTIEVDSEQKIFVYFPSKFKKEADLYLNGEKIGKFFDEETYSIRELGSFDIGDEITVSLVPKEEKIYLRTGCFYFWYFDENEFISAVSELKKGSAEVYSDRDDKLSATVTVYGEDEIMFTTIPYDSGWKLTIDGVDAETFSVLDSSLLAFYIEEGEHKIEMKYRPDCVKYGIIISCSGIVVFVSYIIFEELIKKKKANAEISETEVKIND